MRVLNFAHGSFYMIGAYLAWQAVQWLAPALHSFWLAALAAAVGVALLGMSFDTPVGKLTFNEKTHETDMGEFWGEMVKDDHYPFAVMKDPKYLSQGPYTN